MTHASETGVEREGTPTVSRSLSNPSLPSFPLTKRQLWVLQRMRDDDAELVFERGTGYLELTRISSRTVMALLCRAAITCDQYSRMDKFEWYTINETGREILREAGL
jgi:hypothetical protein